MAQTPRYIRSVARARAFGLSQKEEDRRHLVRLDPIMVFLLLLAMAVMVAIWVFTPNTSDLIVFSQKYLYITAAFVIGSVFVGASYLYDPRQWGPIRRPIVNKQGHELFFDYAFFGMAAGIFSLFIVNFAVTYGGFVPTLSFWNNLTPQIFYGNVAAPLEELMFRVILFSAINRYAPVLIENRLVFILFTGPLDAGMFTVYHTLVYQGSKLALDHVFGESLVICYVWRGTKYAAWASTGIHIFINYTAPA